MSFITYKDRQIEIKDGLLELSNRGIKDISEIKGLDNVLNLKELHLALNQITEIKGLDNLINLEALVLEGNQITEIKGLDNLKNLRWLNLNRNQIKEVKGLKTLKKLLGLYLNKSQITEIKGLDTLINLSILDLSENQITEIKGLDTLRNLSELDLLENQITAIKGLESLENLQRLSLSGNQIPDQVLKELGWSDSDGWANTPQRFIEYCRKEKMDVVRASDEKNKYNDAPWFEHELYQLKEVLFGTYDKNLRNLAKKFNRKGYSKLNKEELIDRLVNFMKSQEFKQEVIDRLEDSQIILLYLILIENGYRYDKDLLEVFLKHGSEHEYEKALLNLQDYFIVDFISDEKIENIEDALIFYVPIDLGEYLKEYIIAKGQKILGIEDDLVEKRADSKDQVVIDEKETQELNKLEESILKFVNDTDFNKEILVSCLLALFDIPINFTSIKKLEEDSLWKYLKNYLKIRFNIFDNQFEKIKDKILFTIKGEGKVDLLRLNASDNSQQLYEKRQEIITFIYDEFKNIILGSIEQSIGSMDELSKFILYININYFMEKDQYGARKIFCMQNFEEDHNIIKDFKNILKNLHNIEITSDEIITGLIKSGIYTEHDRLVDIFGFINEDFLERINNEFLDGLVEENIAIITNQIKKILEFISKNQREPTPKEMIKELDFHIGGTEFYLNLLKNPMEYKNMMESFLKPKAEEAIRKFDNPTLFDLINTLGYDYITALNVGKYLREKGLIEDFPIIPEIRKKGEVKDLAQMEMENQLQIFVGRSGVWESNIFNFKVKIQNNSSVNITKLNVVLDNYPSMLKLRDDNIKAIETLQPNGAIWTPEFRLSARNECVSGLIYASAKYFDPENRRHIIDINPYKISYICPLIEAKQIDEVSYLNKARKMYNQEYHIAFETVDDRDQFQEDIKRKFKDMNFELIELEDPIDDILGYAIDKINKDGLGLETKLKSLIDGQTEVIVKAFCEIESKCAPLLYKAVQGISTIELSVEKGHIMNKLQMFIDKPRDLTIYFKRIIKADDWSDEKKDQWAEIIQEILADWRTVEPKKWEKIAKVILKIALGKVIGEDLSGYITIGIENLFNWIRSKL